MLFLCFHVWALFSFLPSSFLYLVHVCVLIWCWWFNQITLLKFYYTYTQSVVQRWKRFKSADLKWSEICMESVFLSTLTHNSTVIVHNNFQKQLQISSWWYSKSLSQGEGICSMKTVIVLIRLFIKIYQNISICSNWRKNIE